MRGLCLGGGGVKGAFQVGALRKLLLEDKNDYEVLCGVSVGALNVAFLSQAKLGDIQAAYENLTKLWSTINNDKIRTSRWLGMLSALWSTSIYDSKPLQDLIGKNLNTEAVKSSGREVRVGVTSWATGEYLTIPGSDPDFAKYVAASSSFPVFLEPVEVKGQLYSDGGIRNVTPLDTMIRLGVTEIDVIMCSNPEVPNIWDPKSKKAVPGYLARTVDLMSDEIIRADLKVCGLKNDIATINEQYKKIAIRIIQPKSKLVEDSLSFDPKAIKDMIEAGYLAAKDT